MATTLVFLPGEFHGQRSLEGYSPWDCKESDMTELTFTSFHLTLYPEFRFNYYELEFHILKDDAVKVLHSICQQILKTQQCPQDWKKSVFIVIPKKGNTKDC